jgi:hypothetical protein
MPTIFSNLALLPILLAGLVFMRRRGGGTLGMSSLLWKQVWWLFSLARGSFN